MDQVVVAVLRAVPMRVDRPLQLPGAYFYGTAVVVVAAALITSNINISISITNITKADAKLKWNKSTSTSAGTGTSAIIPTLRRMVVAAAAALVVVRMTVGVRVGNRRLPYLTARRALKMRAFIFADVSLEHPQMND